MHFSNRRTFLQTTLGLAGAAGLQAAAHGEARRSFVVFGPSTYILSEKGEIEWEWPGNTRDGWMLPNGNFLLTVSRAKGEHGGKVQEVTRSGEVVFSFTGSQDEVNTSQPLSNGRIMLTEAGANPRILEVDRSGKVQFELALNCQTENTHLQSRMTRKLANGNYLVPLMGEKEVREYTPAGKVVWRASTPHWPFTAIRLPDGNSLIGCTLGNQVIEFDKAGKAVWTLSNDDLPGEPLNDCCGVQRLPNGHTVVTSYHAEPGAVKLTEVTRDKKVVWSHSSNRKGGIHHFQMLTANGKKVGGALLR